MEILIDWLSFTVKNNENKSNEEKLKSVFQLLNLSQDNFTDLPYGLYGYKSQLFYENIRVLYDGNDDMGIHIQISGSGCRYMEHINSNFNWIHFLFYITEKGYNVTRLDIAIDDKENKIKPRKILSELKKGNYESVFRQVTINQSLKLSKTLQDNGMTVYLGSSDSDCRIRIYDKLKEQQLRPDQYQEYNISADKPNWTRLEVVLKKERAKVFIDNLIKKNSIGKVTKAVINNYIRFLDPTKNKAQRNKSRVTSAKWWIDFIETVEKLQLAKEKIKMFIERTIQWHEKSVSASLAMLKIAFDTSGESFDQYIKVILKDGFQKLKSKHYDTVNEYVEAKRFYGRLCPI